MPVSWAESAWRHLGQADDVMAGLARRFGPVQFKVEGAFPHLVNAVVGQQISGRAAAAIRKRVLETVGDPPDPDTLASMEFDALRRCGLSQSKAKCLQGVAHAIVRGELDVDELWGLEDDEVERRLCALAGVGPWTAGSVLIFGMGRPDVLLDGDLGVRKGLKLAYGLDELPSAKGVVRMAKEYGWHPYCTAVNFYLWGITDEEGVW